MNKQINSLLLILAFYVGLLLGFLWSERPLFSDPPVIAPVKLEKELSPKPPPKEMTVKVSIEKSPDPVNPRLCGALNSHDSRKGVKRQHGNGKDPFGARTRTEQ